MPATPPRHQRAPQAALSCLDHDRVTNEANNTQHLLLLLQHAPGDGVTSPEHGTLMQVPCILLSEHVLMLHRRALITGSPGTVLLFYTFAGLRFQEARADAVFGLRMIMSALYDHCPYRGGSSCNPHFATGCTLLIAAVADFATEVVEVGCRRLSPMHADVAFVLQMHRQCTEVRPVRRLQQWLRPRAPKGLLDVK